MKKTLIIVLVALIVVVALTLTMCAILGKDEPDTTESQSTSSTTTSSTTSSTTTSSTTTTTTTSTTPPPPVDPYSKGLEFELDDVGGAYRLVGLGTCTDTEVLVPDMHENKPVSTIDAGAIADNDFVTSVIIPEGVSYIYTGAFSSCTALEYIEIPASVTYIAEDIVSQCANLKKISYGATAAQWYDTCADTAWYGECALTEIVCSDKTIAIPENKNITIWINSYNNIEGFTEAQIERFLAEHPEYSFYNITVEYCGLDDIRSKLLNDTDNAPDLFSMDNVSIQNLVLNDVLAPLDEDVAEKIAAENDRASVLAATVGDNVYAYPYSPTNGYFLYYDSRYISDEQAKTLEGIIEACNWYDKCLNFEIGNSWYTAGFFFSYPVGANEPLCVSNWTYSKEGFPIAVNDTFNSPNGLIAMMGMRKLADAYYFNNSSSDFSNAAAVVSGVWNYNAAMEAYGDYMRATKLPTFTVDGETYQIGSYSSGFYFGTKPQDDEQRGELISALALYLTSEDVQLDRYYEFQMVPSNLNAQQNEDVQADVVISALIAQNEFSTPQGNIPDEWWSYPYFLGIVAIDTYHTQYDLIESLEMYESTINELVVTDQ